jgi:hypothetical protein
LISDVEKNGKWSAGGSRMGVEGRSSGGSRDE